VASTALQWGGDPLAHSEPPPERDLDRVVESFSVKKAQDLGVEEGAIEANFEPGTAAEASTQILDDGAQKALRVVRVVDIARTVPHPEQVTRLGQVSG